MEPPVNRQWRVDLREDPWKDRLVSTICGFGATIPLWRGWADHQWIWDWPGDRITVMILFILAGSISLWADHE